MLAAPFFIVGSGRSGTTLLRAILNSSEKIFIPHESDFLARAFPFYAGKQRFTSEDYAVLTEFFMATSQERGWGMSREYVLGALENDRPQSFAGVNRAIYQAYLEREGCGDAVWGIKAPVLIAHMDRVRATFPEAKIIHMLRDGRDVCLSYIEVHRKAEEKFGPRGIVTGALYWVDGLRRVEKCEGDGLLEVRYQDLLQSPQREIRRVLAFLGIEEEPNLYDNYQRSPRNRGIVLEKHKRDIHRKIFEGIDPENRDKFLSKMSRTSRFVFELLAFPYLTKYGYRREFPVLGSGLLRPVRALAYFLARKFNDWRYGRRDAIYYRAASEAVAGQVRRAGTE